MNCSFDTVVAGAGLAGACSALSLSEHGSVLLVDPGGPAAGASGIGPGLANPLMARKGTPAWRAVDALDAVRNLADRVGLPLTGRRVLRPATGKRQARYFRRTAEEHPALARWVDADAAADRWPWLGVRLGVLIARGGGACDIPAFVNNITDAAVDAGCTLRRDAVAGWREESDGVEVSFDGGAVCRAGRLLICTGADTPRLARSVGRHDPSRAAESGYDAFPSLALTRIKGQAVRVRRPDALPPIPPVSARGYIVDAGDTLFIGSTYERRFDDEDPTPDAAERLVRRAAEVIPAISGAEIVDRVAAVRAAPPGRRMPILGPVGPHGRVWVFTGLGSRGLLLAPLLGAEIPRYFLNPGAIPAELTLP
ncbi:MAG: FAD-binding oxidoreductase [Rhodothermales bacterium]|nr:FAD-binding oxidoreductase [Rhodothermales bacterium]